MTTLAEKTQLEILWGSSFFFLSRSSWLNIFQSTKLQPAPRATNFNSTRQEAKRARTRQEREREGERDWGREIDIEMTTVTRFGKRVFSFVFSSFSLRYRWGKTCQTAMANKMKMRDKFSKRKRSREWEGERKRKVVCHKSRAIAGTSAVQLFFIFLTQIDATRLVSMLVKRFAIFNFFFSLPVRNSK